jgi:uncharacterized protein (TIGR03437 family)
MGKQFVGRGSRCRTSTVLDHRAERRLRAILYFGDAPDFAGLNQVNVSVPSGIVMGPVIVVRLNYISRSSNAVTIGVQ